MQIFIGIVLHMHILLASNNYKSILWSACQLFSQCDVMAYHVGSRIIHYLISSRYWVLRYSSFHRCWLIGMPDRCMDEVIGNSLYEKENKIWWVRYAGLWLFILNHQLWSYTGNEERFTHRNLFVSRFCETCLTAILVKLQRIFVKQCT